MRLLTVLATALALLFLSAAASAQVINGCIKSNGTLKIVSVSHGAARMLSPVGFVTSRVGWAVEVAWLAQRWREARPAR